MKALAAEWAGGNAPSQKLENMSTASGGSGELRAVKRLKSGGGEGEKDSQSNVIEKLVKESAVRG